jgi:hypothetical protein
MTKDQEMMMFKLLAFGAVVLYFYKAAQAQGGTLAGNPYLKGVDPGKIARIGSAFVPQEYREHAEKLGRAALDRIFQ